MIQIKSIADSPEKDHGIEFRPAGEDKLGDADALVLHNRGGDFFRCADQSNRGRAVRTNCASPEIRTEPFSFRQLVSRIDRERIAPPDKIFLFLRRALGGVQPGHQRRGRAHRLCARGARDD